MAEQVTAGAAVLGGAGALLGADQVRAFVRDQLAGAGLEGRRVLVVVPDPSRTCPVALLVSAVHEALAGRVAALSVLVALGTHPGLDEATRAALVGDDPGSPGDRFPGVRIADHAWWDPSALVELGTIPAGRVGELSGGRLAVPVPVRVNAAVLEHDVILLVGPVLPHEVAGFSGGHKYLFPGLSGPEVVDVSHWLGALVTSPAIIGMPGRTPVRALIDEAAALVPGEHLALCVVTRPGSEALHLVAFGDPVAAFEAAVPVSAQTHVRYLDAPVERVVSVVPERYSDLWTGAKGFYKVEPVVADGGEVVLYAPHIGEVSRSHPGIAEIGYHCRDYVLAHFDRLSRHPWGELAHCTHLFGAGTYDERHGERARVRVVLATGIPEDAVRAVNLAYRDPARVDLAAAAREPGTLVVPDAGEELYRLRPAPPPRAPRAPAPGSSRLR